MSEHQIDDSETMLAPNEAGKLLGVSGKTMIRMMEDGEFPGYKIGLAWKFMKGDILRYRDSRKFQADKPKDTEAA
jgi:excisionase family DNA binding protein